VSKQKRVNNPKEERGCSARNEESYTGANSQDQRLGHDAHEPLSESKNRQDKENPPLANQMKEENIAR